ncbi:hypothetical protein A7A08_01744 [Methyloligella halotolerans]|uniref:Uncharacterized protein n=1 Tax=Methyloligella halotolerans TaxID=1177755 RepID=A0A1E2S069_9HYPH|nr:hypothetical protein [Methyloligella halotolerans]ODA67709.1 hypothetical protein A7A08_01744 [Methyloligella halotolerans]
MIQAILYGALGFFLAGLIAVLFVPALWNRAARITRRQLEDSLPLTAAEIQADKDRLRAEFATELRQLENELEKAKAKAVRELVETSKRRVRIDELEGELSELKAKLDETESAKQALVNTLSRGLPQMEEELDTAREIMTDIEKTQAELRFRYGRDREALRFAQETVKRQAEDLQNLRAALEGGDSTARQIFGKSDTALAKENRQMLARISVLEEELAMARHYDAENYLLREEMRNLSMQILRAAQGEEAPLPELIPEAPPENIDDYVAASQSFEEVTTSPLPSHEAEPSEPARQPDRPAPELKADPERAPKPAKAGFGSRLKEKLTSQPKAVPNGDTQTASKSASKSEPGSLSERMAARRGKTVDAATSGEKRQEDGRRSKEAPEAVGSEQG